MENALKMIEEFQIPIVKIDPKRGYWLIRTQAGLYFDEFHLDQFIGVGWNEFNEPGHFKESNKERTMETIKDTLEDVQAWRVFTQLKRFFHEIKVGDIVMIPSVNSTHIIFGEVMSDVYFEEITEETIEEETCPYEKRRKVKWIKSVKRKSLDPYLYRMMQSHFSISNASEYADAIDRTLHSFYYKGDQAHLILKVEQENDIPLLDLLDALQAPLALVDVINELDPGSSNFNKRDLDAKLRVQSPGMIELASAGPAFALVAILGMVIVAIVGGNLSFKKTKQNGDQTEGALQTEGLYEKLLKWRHQSHKIDMDKKMLEVDDATFSRMMAIQSQLNRATETLKMELPIELTNLENETDIGTTEIVVVEESVVEESDIVD
ncbi:hypothetical protein [Sporosarcina sp. FSL K6-5500]|uniref:hypothetical protein n=1 Tax=Sporosarcina sp. FSL K6-5500 TaxID=2921558 RepID=UPI0030F6E683